MKPGDKIVCILNKRVAFDPKPRLYVDNIYTVKDCRILGFSNVYSISVEEHCGVYTEDCFITNIEHRKRKLKKINSTI